MIGIYDYTVILTYLSALSAVSGIALCISGNPKGGIILLMLCGLLDMFDGPVARTKKNRSETAKKFGIQIDSLSDLIAFGVLPAAVCISFTGSVFGIVSGMLFALCALIRLAYFNVTEEERSAATTEKRKYYEGLPVTSIALILPLFCAFANLLDSLFTLILPCLMLLVAFLFIYRFKVTKPGKKGIAVMSVAGAAILILVILFLR